MRLLLDERELRPEVDLDAVVTVSDLPALAAAGAAGRPYRSRSIALAGFNDAPEKFVHAPLTREVALLQQGRKAVEMLLALLAGEQGQSR